MPAKNATPTTIDSNDVRSDRSGSGVVASAVAGDALTQPDRAALEDAPSRQEPAVRVQEQDPHHDADPERQHDDDEVLFLEAERRLGEVRAEDAEDADERGRDSEIDERPADLAMRPDVAEALAQLAEHR